MANSSAIENWLIEKAKLFNILVEKAHWGDLLIPGLHDFSLTIEYEGHEFHGSGSAMSEDIALHKAFSEALERIVYWEQKFPTTNGMAAHINSELAAKAASQELIERDLFLCHFLTKAPFPKAESIFNTFPSLEPWANRTKIKFLTFRLGKQGAICSADGRGAQEPFGFLISSAYKDSFLESNESALISAARWAHRIHSKKFTYNSISLNEFERISQPSLADHGRLARNLDYAQKISYLFDGSETEKIEAPLTSNQIKFYKPINPHFADCPVFIARSTSNSVQNLFSGKASLESINLSRLKIFSGRSVSWDDLNHLPHPIN